MENIKAKICVPVCVQHWHELDDAVTEAADTGDFIEIRFDCLDPIELASAFEEYASLRQRIAKPFIVTLRPFGEGGHQRVERDPFGLRLHQHEGIDEGDRLSFWREGAAFWSS